MDKVLRDNETQESPELPTGELGRPGQAAPEPKAALLNVPDEAPSSALVVASGPPPAETPAFLARLRSAKMGDAFWKSATLFSLAVNLVLVLGLLVVGTQVFGLKDGVVTPLVGGLYDSFVQMDQSHIVTTIQVNDTIHVNDTIQVNDTIPVVFDVPLQTNTVVVLTQDTTVPQTTVFLNGIGVPTDIVLPAGTPLQINLSLIVPVSQTVPVVLDVPINLEVPVSLQVPVDIPLDQTDLHRPFTNLANLVGPYDVLLDKLPASWAELFGRD
jgi:hypothetical protein